MNLNKNDYPKLEEYFKNYEDLKGQLMYRRYQLLYQPHDHNIGGGKSNLPHSPVEKEVIKLQEDPKYRNLSSIIHAVEDVYQSATKEQKLIIEYRYWEKDPTVIEWEDIAHEMSKLRNDKKIISTYAALRMRNKILKQLADKIGWVTI